MAGHILVGRNTQNPYQLMVRNGVDQAVLAAGNLKRIRAIIEAMRLQPDGSIDYTDAASKMSMSSPADVEAMYNLIVGADSITTSPAFGALVTYLG